MWILYASSMPSRGTRGHSMKIFKQHTQHDVKCHCLSFRAVNDWNNLVKKLCHQKSWTHWPLFILCVCRSSISDQKRAGLFGSDKATQTEQSDIICLQKVTGLLTSCLQVRYSKGHHLDLCFSVRSNMDGDPSSSRRKMIDNIIYKPWFRTVYMRILSEVPIWKELLFCGCLKLLHRFWEDGAVHVNSDWHNIASQV